MSFRQTTPFDEIASRGPRRQAGRDSRGSHWRNGRRRERAFTLVETMVAAIVLVLGITASLTTIVHGFQAVDTARHFTYASQVMQSEMERLRLKNWAQIQEMQDGTDHRVAAAAVSGTATDSFTCTRTIADVRTDMKEITLIATWRGLDGRTQTARYITRYSKSGLYDYFYTAH